MARLLDYPRGAVRVAYQRLSGPRAVGAAASESVTGKVQTVASAFGAWRYQFSIRPMRRDLFRRYRGMVTALHGGANAVRVSLCDPDIMSWADAGVATTPAEVHAGCAWSNGLPWSNGENWAVAKPIVTVAEDAALGATIITLDDEHWGHGLLGGEWIGFLPFHFGKYEITEVLDDGEYRIWPPLRKALVADESYATLNPVMAMRMESEAGGAVGRGLTMSEGMVLTLVEVEDADVRDHFAD